MKTILTGKKLKQGVYFMKKWICIFLFLFSCCHATSEEIYLFTVPKAGSHLINRCLNIFTSMDKTGKVYFDHFQYHNNKFTPSGFLRKHPEAKVIVHVRDLRDVFVSAVYHIDWTKQFLSIKIKDYMDWENTETFEEKICYLMNPENGKIPFLINRIIRRACLSINQPGVYVSRFETLVGAKGGGNDDLCRQEIESLAEYLGFSLSAEELDDCHENLFGVGTFFRKGQIGSWKEHFTKKAKKVFKENYGQALIELGYENDLNW